MAHALDTEPSAPSAISAAELEAPAVLQARVDLAACSRMAARLGMHEGVCNHFSAILPGRDDLYLVNPFGFAFEEITASSLLVCDFDGNVVAGVGSCVISHSPRSALALVTTPSKSISVTSSS